MSQIKVLQNQFAVEILGEKWSPNQTWNSYSLLKEPINWEVCRVNGAYVFGFVDNPTPISTQFQDLTGWECFHNKVHIEDHLPESCSPLDCFQTSLQDMPLFARRLQQQFPDEEFELFTSFDGEYAVLNFHKIRAGEEYLIDDLDAYASEAIVVLRILRS